ncbi:restriction endonuclease [Chitinolyticbacter meiyuanensis]|uniref:restriction endonuclease n=1 Tax=Chitinolyticbacter meiyuanensis TaxID=682798 RepID=UPI0016522D90|nr:restriction endonuclease [Chitinolyticbacter meiyuanensis]
MGLQKTSKPTTTEAPDFLMQPFREVPSIHPRDSLAFFADQLRIPVAELITQFQSAGVINLSEHSFIDYEHKSTLLDFLKRKHITTSQIFEDKAPLANRIEIVHSINLELLKVLARQPHLMHQLDPRKFEELVARLLEDNGCEVTLTKRTRDGGYDIFGRIKGIIASPVFLAECKRYSPENKVGVEVIRSVFAVTELHRANLGLVITSSSFTKDAIKEKVRIGDRIELKEFNDLNSWLNRYDRG